MTLLKFFYIKELGIIGFLLAVMACPGCLEYRLERPVSESTPSPSAQKVFYPPAPDIPRLQFLVSFTKSGDLNAHAGPKASPLERFVLGKQEPVQDMIFKPYGVAFYDGKLYVCDVQKRVVEILDFRNKTFGYLSEERHMTNPVNICVVDGIKYVADPAAGKVYVFNRDNSLSRTLGDDLDLEPVDVAVRGRRCYVTDMKTNQVVVLDIASGQIVQRMGQAGDALGQFVLIGDLALDDEEHVVVTDKLLGRVTMFDRSGLFLKAFGKAGDSIFNFVRPKGVDVDRAGRIWVVDAAPEVAKIYTPSGQLLMYFGFPGSRPGSMNLPASIVIDYDNLDLFRSYFAKDAQIEFLVFVSNQYGQKINVYGFGRFPRQEQAIEEARQAAAAEGIESSAPSERAQDQHTPVDHREEEPAGDLTPQTPDREQRMQEIADIYYRSMQLYRAGRYQEAQAGFIEVLNSGTIPPLMVKTIESYLQEIDKRTRGSSSAGQK